MPNVSFQKYIYASLKDVSKDTGISNRAMQAMNCMTNQLADRVYNEAVRAARMKGRATIGKQEVTIAMQRILPAELSKHAFSEVEKATAKYQASLA